MTALNNDLKAKNRQLQGRMYDKTDSQSLDVTHKNRWQFRIYHSRIRQMQSNYEKGLGM